LKATKLRAHYFSASFSPCISQVRDQGPKKRDGDILHCIDWSTVAKEPSAAEGCPLSPAELVAIRVLRLHVDGKILSRHDIIAFQNFDRFSNTTNAINAPNLSAKLR
jgi:hypothetical protein